NHGRERRQIIRQLQRRDLLLLLERRHGEVQEGTREVREEEVASSINLRARSGLNTPQLQNRAMVAAARSGERRPCFTHSTSFRTKPKESMPWPHMVASSSV